jgi:hypothetical protein
MITAGPGMKLAGHATSSSGDIQFMVAGGAGRYAYYIGAFFLFWLPLLHLTRGALAWITSIMYQPTVESEFWLLMAGIGIATAFAFVLLLVLSRVVAKIIPRVDFRKLSVILLALIVGVVWSFASTPDYNPLRLVVTILATAGILFVMFGAVLKLAGLVRVGGNYFIYILALVGALLAFVSVESLLIGFGNLAEGARAMVILTISTGIGLIPLTFRTMWTNTLLGYFFPIMLNMAGLSAGILLALGVY